jgi:hypothetical protein
MSKHVKRSRFAGRMQSGCYAGDVGGSVYVRVMSDYVLRKRSCFGLGFDR